MLSVCSLLINSQFLFVNKCLSFALFLEREFCQVYKSRLRAYSQHFAYLPLFSVFQCSYWETLLVCWGFLFCFLFFLCKLCSFSSGHFFEISSFFSVTITYHGLGLILVIWLEVSLKMCIFYQFLKNSQPSSYITSPHSL